MILWPFRWDTVAEVLCGSQQICQDPLGLGGCRGAWGISFLFFLGEISNYPLVMTNIAMENPSSMEVLQNGKIIYFYGPWLPWLC